MAGLLKLASVPGFEPSLFRIGLRTVLPLHNQEWWSASVIAPLAAVPVGHPTFPIGPTDSFCVDIGLN